MRIVALLVTAAAAAVLAAPAHAVIIAGKDCERTSSVKFCAYFAKNPDLGVHSALVEITDRSGRRRVVVRTVASTLFRKVDGVWRVNETRSTPTAPFLQTNHGHAYQRPCTRFVGTYKVNGVVEWKVRGRLYREGISSKPVRLRRC